MLYFAYGSNCNIDVFHDYLVAHDLDPTAITNPRRALLDGWQLRCNYLMSGFTGAANIAPAKGKHVEGVLMEVTPEVHDLLRRKEGWPRRYREATVCVRMPRTRQVVNALTYIVTDECRLPTDMPVHPTYRSTILEAARYWKFSRDYQKRLRKVLCTASDCAQEAESRHVRSGSVRHPRAVMLVRVTSRPLAQ